MIKNRREAIKLLGGALGTLGAANLFADGNSTNSAGSEAQNLNEQNSAADRSGSAEAALNLEDKDPEKQDFAAKALNLAQSSAVQIKTGEYFMRANDEPFMLSLSAGEYEIGCLDENANFIKANFVVNQRK